MKHKLYNRLLSLALAVGLVVGMLPGSAAVSVTEGSAVEPRLSASQFTVQHVDAQGNQIADSDIKNLSRGENRNPNAYIKKISGYNYSHAKVGNSVVTEVRDNGYWWGEYKYKLQYYSDGWNTWNNSTPLTLVYTEPLDTVETVDSASKGVNISLFNYSESKINSATESRFKFGGGGSNNSWNIWESGAGVYQGIVGNQLTTVNGTKVPSFNVNVGRNNLSYLFTDNNYATAYTGLNHLFLKSTYDSTGYYEYDAGYNFATIADNLRDKDFKVYNQPYKPGDTAAATPKFLPFNDLSNNADTLNENADYLFGMMVDFEFIQPQNGEITNNGTTNDMVFEFTGDDDVWVFIDDVLVLDMGGIHDAMTGSINFATGDVTVNKVRPDVENQKKVLHDIMLNAKGQSWVNENMVQNEDGDWVFKDYTSHTFNYYYLERGAGGSNCRIRFNLQTVPKGSLNVGKTAVGESEDIDYKFQLENSYGQAVANQPYTISGTSQTGTTDSNGYFTLKSGQLATFTDLSDGAYKVTELDGNDYKLSDYTTTVTTTDGNGTSSGQIATSGTVTIDPATIATVGFTNTKAEKGEGNLEITKTFTDANGNEMAIPEDLVSIKLTIKETYNPGGNVKPETYTHQVILTKQEDGSFSGTLSGVRYYTDFEITKEELLNAEGKPIANAGDWTMGDFVLDRYADAEVTAQFYPSCDELFYTLPNSGYVLVKSKSAWYLVMNHVPVEDAEKAEFKAMVIDDILAAIQSLGGAKPSANDVQLLTIDEAAELYDATVIFGEAGNVTLQFAAEKVWAQFYAGSFNMTNVTMKATLNNTLDKAAQTQVSVNKVWSDSATVDHIGDSVTVKLMNGSAVVQTATLNSGNDWTYLFTNLPKYNANGSLIQYTVTEDAVSGYTTSITGDMNMGFTITNTREVGSLTITKTVEGLENDPDTLAILKNQLTFTVTGPNGYKDTVAFNATGWTNNGNIYTYTINNLPTGAYTVEESGYELTEYGYNWTGTKSPVEGTVTNNDSVTAPFTNTYTPANIKLTITKKIEGDSYGDGKDMFNFRITCIDCADKMNVGKVWYVHINGEGSKTITLPVGKYKVEELSNMHYKLVNVEPQPEEISIDTRIRGLIEWGYDLTEDKTITFTNKPATSNIPSDGGGVKNDPIFDETGRLVGWRPEKYDTVGDITPSETPEPTRE